MINISLISRYPGTCMCVLESDFLLVTRFHGSIDILNRDLCLEISLGAHTGYISGISVELNKVIYFLINHKVCYNINGSSTCMGMEVGE